MKCAVFPQLSILAGPPSQAGQALEGISGIQLHQ